MIRSAVVARTESDGDDTRSPAGGDGRPLSLGMLENALGFHLRLAQDASFQDYMRRIEGADLRPGWFATLALIDENPNINQKALSEASGRDKSTTSLLLRDLERQGLVERTRSRADRRTAVLNLTTAGLQQLAELKAAAIEHEARLSAIVGDRREEFLAMLKHLVAELSRDELD